MYSRGARLTTVMGGKVKNSSVQVAEFGRSV
jgi:hypothetical protein